MIGLFDELGLGDRLQWAARRRPSSATARSAGSTARSKCCSSPRSRRWRASASAPPSPLLKADPRPRALRGADRRPLAPALDGPRGVRGRLGAAARGKFGADAEQIGMPWFWARIHDRTPQLGYPRGGFQLIYEALAADLERRGGRWSPAAPSSASSGAATSRADHVERAPTRSTPSSARSRPASSSASTRDLPDDYVVAVLAGPAALLGPLPDPGARPPAPGRLLGQRGRPRLSVRGAGRAHQLDAGLGLRRQPSGLPRATTCRPTTSCSACPTRRCWIGSCRTSPA